MFVYFYPEQKVCCLARKNCFLKKGLICPAISSKNDLFKVNKNLWVNIIKSKMSYSESELDSNFAINSVSDFDSASESDSESDSSSAFMNLDICIFFTLYLHSSK